MSSTVATNGLKMSVANSKKRRGNSGSNPTNPGLDLREVLSSARRNFKQSLKDSATSTPSILSPKISPSSRPQKSASAPASPTKSNKRTAIDTNSSKLVSSKRLRRSTPLQKEPWIPNDSTSRDKIGDENENKAESKLLSAEQKSTNTEDDSKNLITPNKSDSTVGTLIASDLKRRPSNNVSMNEVIKLHQDEGVIHLLHALPASRRRPTQMVSSVSRRSSLNEPRPCSATKMQSQSQESKAFSNAGGSRSKKVLQNRETNVLTKHVDQASIKPCTQDELMTPHALGLIKQLPSKEYIRLWSSPSRYELAHSDQEKPDIVTVQTSDLAASGSKTSPSGSSICSDISSVSRHVPVRPWSITTKYYKDILIRTYPTFAQILLSPVSTGLKFSLNANVCDEIIDALKQLSSESDCRAVLLSGIGGTFCQGVDLTVLTYDSSDRQRRSAEHLAGALRRLVSFLLSYPKVLIAGVNGVCRGAGLTLLPFFDVVFASDKATFCSDYAKLGQIPECFASHTIVTGHPTLSEVLLFGKTFTASEALNFGLISSVIWPDKFFEEIIPRIELLELMSPVGLQVVKSSIKRSLKDRLSMSVMEQETKHLIQNWTHHNFAKAVRAHLKSNRLTFQ